jgi:hypothetical protein
MMVDHKDLYQASPWRPITDLTDLAVLGKLAEELAEASAATARCIIQGVHESEPVTGKLNRQWLADELADVLATAYLAMDRFGISQREVGQRLIAKTKHLKGWHALIGKMDQPI